MKKLLQKSSTWFAVIVKSTKIIKVIKLLKFAKPLLTILSIVLSAGVYCLVYNPYLGIGLVLLIGIHELGHVMAMNKEGFPTRGPVFIPFVGAMLFAPKEMDRRQEAIIGIGGPVIGSLGSLLLVGLYFIFRLKWMLLLGYLGLFINLFNLIPISPLDGGRITQAVGKNFYIIGMGLLMLITIVLRQPQLLLIWIICMFDIKFIKLKTRFIFASVVWIALVFMTVTGIGLHKGDFWICTFDSIVGVIYLLLIWTAIRPIETSRFIIGNSEQMEDPFSEGEHRPTLSKLSKRQWLFSWLGLSLFLSVLMILLTPYLK